MPRSNPSSVGYARGTQVTTQLTARETFGGTGKKAGLGFWGKEETTFLADRNKE